MKFSKLPFKTSKTAAESAKLKSHQFLIQAGFIRESTAGRYFFLPLGMRVRDKIVKIIETEMDAAGALKLITPVLHPLQLWEETNRASEASFELMKIDDRRGASFALGGTAEEMMVDLVRKFQLSYRDLPFNIYQFSQKFRDELRARGGLLRVREFLMKDAYSFHADEKCFQKEYEKMWKTYEKIFTKLNLKTTVVESDGGYIGGDYCHEFVVEDRSGESKFFATSSYAAHEDVAKFDLNFPNADEEILKMEIVPQPEWVQKMPDNEKFWKQPRWRFLKNVVFKNRVTGEIIVATIRGDLEVNKTKLENLLKMNQMLVDADDSDLQKIGTKTGFVNSWGLKNCRFVADESLKTVKNFIGGQKTETTDAKNVNYGRDFSHEICGDIAFAAAGFEFQNEKLVEKKGIEVGNIFQLGFHYSSKMRANFVGRDGGEKPFYMGCYGIGVGRTLATIAEKFCDEKGLVWPKNIAPFQIHLISLNENDAAEKIYEKLKSENFEVFFDDRDARAGEKFADADLIGIPARVLISKKTLEKNSVEIKLRNSDEIEFCEIENLAEKLREILGV
jgi:prolyl-tRNA synthetase